VIEVVDGLTRGRDDDVRRLLFAYMAETEVAAGRPTPDAVEDLSGPLRREVVDPHSAYPPPGGVLLAIADGHAVRCLGVRLLDRRTAELKRFFVLPDARRTAAARALVSAGSARLREIGVERVIGDVLASRAKVIAWYRRLGFTVLPATDQDLVALERTLVTR
jgi:GNAT superfamily N-acetyltransferase